ncbi:MAG: toll/interleukin-1 receptor domain-containing protein [Henriciella sp.]|uniref:toll/interleukin-1 receptor domain-containing protein n=1 Tax=Henriciella sp. TaxID=1968823 RepID=UPI003C73F734
MKQRERFELIDKLARELQDRFKTYELPGYLSAFDVDVGDTGTIGQSKWVWAKSVLSSLSVDKILEIARDMDLDQDQVLASPPDAWKDTRYFRLFISHISKDRKIAMRLRDCLAPLAIKGFVAHEDILPTRLWEDEIVRALHCMDALVSIHTPGFSESNWCQQEVGFAFGRGTKIISLRMGEDPTGFIGKSQALLRKGRMAEEIAAEIEQILKSDDRASVRLAEAKNFEGWPNYEDELPF